MKNQSADSEGLFFKKRGNFVLNFIDPLKCQIDYIAKPLKIAENDDISSSNKRTVVVKVTMTNLTKSDLFLMESKFVLNQNSKTAKIFKSESKEIAFEGGRQILSKDNIVESFPLEISATGFVGYIAVVLKRNESSENSVEKRFDLKVSLEKMEVVLDLDFMNVAVTEKPFEVVLSIWNRSADSKEYKISFSDFQSVFLISGITEWVVTLKSGEFGKKRYTVIALKSGIQQLPDVFAISIKDHDYRPADKKNFRLQQN
ncbi:hypothetical protein MHBO_000800 [Bonamia ostreae]|uniref:Uncharacterized protein n=2 Tax=Bonamia ostreae TaxID=126728 RepID=A0ABV2AGW8_9EUKA